MPPRRYKRRRGSVGPGFSRNVRRRTGYSYRPSGSRSFPRYKRKSARRSYRGRRRTRRYKRSYRRRSSRKSRTNSFQRKVVNSLATARVFYAEYGAEHSVPVTTGVVRPCVYFAVERYNAASTYGTVSTVELFDWNHVMTIADRFRFVDANLSSTAPAAGANGINDLKQRISISGKMISWLRNQSTETCFITAYYCRPRGKISWATNVTGTHNPYQYLSAGFANNGLDSGVVGVANVTMTNANFTPFQSFDFTHNFKVYKVKKVSLAPSEQKAFVVSCKSRVIRPIDWVEFAGTTNSTSWLGSAQKYDYQSPQKFILYKIEARPAGYGAVQGTYSKQIQMTSPTIVIDTTFKYFAKDVPQTLSTSGTIETLGIIDPTTAGHAPAIIVPDGDVVGVESEAP